MRRLAAGWDQSKCLGESHLEHAFCHRTSRACEFKMQRMEGLLTGAFQKKDCFSARSPGALHLQVPSVAYPTWPRID